MKIIFMGTPAFAVPALQAVLQAGHEVVAVYCQPPRPAGRGKKLTQSAVHQAALAANLPVFTPTSLKDEAAQADFAAHGADVAVVAAYGLLLPAAILEACPLGCINIHPSLLPRWRGAAPLVAPILHGDEATGMCLMQMDKGLDTGAVLARQQVPLHGNETTGQLHDAMASLGATMLVKLLAEIAAGNAPQPVPQAEDGATYAAKITKADARINWQQSAIEIERAIRAFQPFPCAWTEHEGAMLKIHAAEIESAEAGERASAGEQAAPAGSILPPHTEEMTLRVQCGQGVLLLTSLQRAGGKPLKAHEFLRGYALKEGEMLG